MHVFYFNAVILKQSVKCSIVNLPQGVCYLRKIFKKYYYILLSKNLSHQFVGKIDLVKE
jgi:hypothetical protein